LCVLGLFMMDEWSLEDKGRMEDELGKMGKKQNG
jgi:hypothetical protein